MKKNEPSFHVQDTTATSPVLPFNPLEQILTGQFNRYTLLGSKYNFVIFNNLILIQTNKSDIFTSLEIIAL